MMPTNSERNVKGLITEYLRPKFFFRISMFSYLIVTPCSSKPCHNKGICTVQGDSFICSCLDGYNGTRCQNKIQSKILFIVDIYHLYILKKKLCTDLSRYVLILWRIKKGLLVQCNTTGNAITSFICSSFFLLEIS